MPWKICVLSFFLSFMGLEAGAENLLVLAGSASKPVLEDAIAAFEQAEGASATLVLGGSGELLSQVRLTGKGDLYLPGSHDFLERARTFGLIATGSEKVLAYLVPALVVPASNPAGIKCLEDLAKPGVRIGIGHPETVCVGLYAVEILEKSGLSSRIRPTITAYFESCAKVANSVILGSVDAVIGWREFGSWSPGKLLVIPLPSDRIPRVATLPGAVLTTASPPELAPRFLEFMASEKGRAIYSKWGYLTAPDDVASLAPKATLGGFYELPKGWK